MTYVSGGKNCFRSPASDDILTYILEDIKAIIDQPAQINQHHFGTNERQFAGYKTNNECYDIINTEFVFLSMC